MLVSSPCSSTWPVLPLGFQGCQKCCCTWQFSSKQGCVSIAGSCVGPGLCIESLLHSGVLLNTTEPVNTLPSPMDILAHVKNVSSEMSTNHIISGAKVSHYNKSPLQWIVLFLLYHATSRPGYLTAVTVVREYVENIWCTLTKSDHRTFPARLGLSKFIQYQIRAEAPYCS